MGIKAEQQDQARRYEELRCDLAMAAYYTVQEGDFLVKIAKDNGFNDYHILWDHPQNAELKLKRKSANAIYPGDRLFIPDKDPVGGYYATGRRHVIHLEPSPHVLRIVFKNIDDEPITHTECAMIIAEKDYSLLSNSDGLVAELIPKGAAQGKIRILDMEFPIQIGELDPVDTERGQKVRLGNLGYFFGTLDAEDKERLKSALEEFQCDQGLNVTGACDSPTQAALKDAYGC